MDEIKLFENKSDCCGCEACLNICPKKAISMVIDKYGFLYPQINDRFCVGCGACKKVCAYQYLEEINEPIETYASITVNTDISQSASGGIFASIAKSVIDDGGIVFGCSMESMDNVLTPEHIAVDNLDFLIKIQGSKYVQSSIGTTYQKVKEELERGRVVIFSGTPCQIAGIKSYLKKDYDNLLLIDIICHGVPSAKFFQDYIKQLEKKLKGKVFDFKFRDKSRGWGLNGKAIYKTSTGKIKSAFISVAESSYFSLFLDSDIYRENCYKCKYASNNRPGDITIGDYWGIQKEHPELLTSNGGVLNQTEGISCIIINTEKGKRYVKQYKTGLLLNVSSFEKIARSNGQLNAPSSTSTKRTKILELYRNKGYEAVEKWFIKDRGVKLYVAKFKNLMPKGMNKRMKKILGRG